MCDRMKGTDLLQWCVNERQLELKGANTYNSDQIGWYEKAAREDLRKENYTDAEIDTMIATLQQAYLTPVEAKENKDVTPASAEENELTKVATN